MATSKRDQAAQGGQQTGKSLGWRRLGFVIAAWPYWPLWRRCVTVTAPTATAQVPSLGRKAAAPQEQQPQRSAAVQSTIPAIVALVNAEEISRDELAAEALRHYGEEVLESMINKHLISQACGQRGLEVSHAEIDAEIERLAQSFSTTREQWLRLLQKERGIGRQQYARDIIWPTLALRKLAATQLTVSQEEIDQAYESEFGEAVKVRLIACDTNEKARNVHAAALADPAKFGARQDRVGRLRQRERQGLIQPIRRHRGDRVWNKRRSTCSQAKISEIVPVITSL